LIKTIKNCWRWHNSSVKDLWRGFNNYKAIESRWKALGHMDSIFKLLSPILRPLKCQYHILKSSSSNIQQDIMLRGYLVFMGWDAFGRKQLQWCFYNYKTGSFPKNKSFHFFLITIFRKRAIKNIVNTINTFSKIMNSISRHGTKFRNTANPKISI
jgi:hypothetical protein